MKLASYRIDDLPSYGIVGEDGIIDVRRRLPDTPATLLEVLEHGMLQSLHGLEGRHSADFALNDVLFDPPIHRPGKIFCVGVNYINRNEEYKDGSDTPVYPSLFMRTPDSLVGHGQSIVRPIESEQLDYEGEIAMIIGKKGRRIPEENAADHIAGLTCMNEGTIRDWVRHGKFNVTQGKNFDRTGAIGPWFVTRDELNPMSVLRVSTRVNGEIRQQDKTSSLLFPFARLIAYISTFATLYPGDVISTGTPEGAGARRDPPVFLAKGDTVEVEVPGIGALRNEVVEENTPCSP